MSFRRVGLELTPHEIEIMKDLKKMFDPKGIMNPGKDFCLRWTGILSKERKMSLLSYSRSRKEPLSQSWNPHESEDTIQGSK